MGRVKPTAKIYLKFGSRKVVLPVNPEEISISYPTDNKDYDVIGTGQVVVQRKPALQEVSWEGFFPASTSDPYVNSGADDPEYYVKKIQIAMKSQQKIRLIITRDRLFDTNLRCIVSDFEITDKGGEPGDIYYSITLREYRDYSPRTVSIITSQGDGTQQQTADAAAEEERPVETPVLRVGATVIANGQYWYDSYGAKPFGTANNIQTTVTRIVEGNPYPVHIGSYGWLRADQLQIVG